MKLLKMYVRIFLGILAVSIEPALAVESLRIIVMADWGGLPEPFCHTILEERVAKEMSVIASTYGVDAILALGDNFYYLGVQSDNDKRFECTWEKVYKYDSLKDIPWYLVAGNHDHYGNVSAEIAFSAKAKTWNFPNYYYLQSFKSGGMSVDVIMIDTIILCGNVKDHGSRPPKGPDDKEVANQQLDWIKNQMEKSSADFLFVAGHYPVYSIAKHGPTQCLIDILLPLLVKYDAVYLSGHDHNLQHLQTTQEGKTMNFFVSGSANFAENNNAHAKDVPPNSSKFFWTKREIGGFAYMEFTKMNGTFHFVAGNGLSLYTEVLKPRK